MQQHFYDLAVDFIYEDAASFISKATEIAVGHFFPANATCGDNSRMLCPSFPIPSMQGKVSLVELQRLRPRFFLYEQW